MAELSILTIHLKGLTAEEMAALGEPPVEAIDEEWFEVMAEDGIVCLRVDWLEKLIRMVPNVLDYTITPAPDQPNPQG